MLLFFSNCHSVCQPLLSSSLYSYWLKDEGSSHSHFLKFSILAAGFRPTVQGITFVRGSDNLLPSLSTFFLRVGPPYTQTQRPW